MRKNARLKIIFKNYYLFIRDFFKDLFDDRLGHYASSSLSWSTLFSIIPLLVIFLSIFTKMPLFENMYDKVEKLIFSNLMPTDSKVIMEHINTYMENSDKLGYVGAFYVIFAAIMFFKNYDYIVNDIFDTPSRTLWQAIRTYTLLVIILPVLMALSFFLSSFIQGYLDKTSITSIIHLYSFLPYFIVWMIFYVAYQLSANIHIEVSAATYKLIYRFTWYGTSLKVLSSSMWYITKPMPVSMEVSQPYSFSFYGFTSLGLFLYMG